MRDYSQRPRILTFSIRQFNLGAREEASMTFCKMLCFGSRFEATLGGSKLAPTDSLG
jgi:hypothetical protein